MQVNEFRVGNYIYSAAKKPVMVTLQHLQHIQDGNKLGYEPIPITEDVLPHIQFKLKAEKDDVLYTGWFFAECGNGYKMRVYFDETKTCCYDLNKWITIKIPYLHELQNLFFCLTKTELKGTL